MAETQPKADFQFVNSTIDTPTMPRDHAVRALIRKQAMKKASAARRRDGNYGKHNLRQYPIFVIDQDSGGGEAPTQMVLGTIPALQGGEVISKYCGSQSFKDKDKEKTERGVIERQRCLTKLAIAESLPVGLTAKGYELMSMKSDFNILDLSTLATLHVGRAARAALSQDPGHLISQLRSHKKSSYLSYLPKLYGHFTCLSDATDCVIARARQIISPHENWETAVITFYMRALSSLQKALDNPALRYKPEVLCATEILALYELLHPLGETAWIRHAAGAARLIQLRGPKNYNTEFEKALFISHTGPIITECLLNNERCFLEESAWQNVFRSAILEDDLLLSDRSEATISLIMIKAFIPGLYYDITNIICLDVKPDMEFVEAATKNLRQRRANLLMWRARYETMPSQYPDMHPGSSTYDSYCKIFSTFIASMMVATRLLAALVKSERAELEEYTQGLADEMLALDAKVRLDSAQTSLFMAHTKGVALTVKATHEEWREYSDGKSEVCSISGGILARSKLENWCNMFGRKIP